MTLPQNALTGGFKICKGCASSFKGQVAAWRNGTAQGTSQGAGPFVGVRAHGPPERLITSSIHSREWCAALRACRGRMSQSRFICLMLTPAACIIGYGREGDRQVFGRRRHVHRAAGWHGRLLSWRLIVAPPYNCLAYFGEATRNAHRVVLRSPRDPSPHLAAFAPPRERLPYLLSGAP